MKNLFLVLAACLACINVYSFTPEIKTITLNDGEVIKGRLCLPDKEIKTIVFCVPGTGPSTYLTRRSTFNFYDELANGFCQQGLAFFSYNRRGCENGDTPPLYVDVDSLKYTKYNPMQEAQDIETMIVSLCKDKRFKNCKIVLYGVSEGSIIAPIVAERANVKISALLLHGYANDNMYDIIKWQNEGHGVMLMVNSIFDKNSDKRINVEEYECADEVNVKQRAYLFQNLAFDSLDVVKDGFIDIADIKVMRTPFHNYIMQCIEEDNYQWIKSNYFNVMPRWFKSHFALEPNKTRLLRLDIPIHIFHGEEDANVPVESVLDIKSRFDVCNKTNLTIHIFKKHNHDLNFLDWITKKNWSEGFNEIYNTAKQL